jgi:hypothetical protein
VNKKNKKYPTELINTFTGNSEDEFEEWIVYIGKDKWIYNYSSNSSMYGKEEKNHTYNSLEMYEYLQSKDSEYDEEVRIKSFFEYINNSLNESDKKHIIYTILLENNKPINPKSYVLTKDDISQLTEYFDNVDDLLNLEVDQLRKRIWEKWEKTGTKTHGGGMVVVKNRDPILDKLLKKLNVLMKFDVLMVE